MGHSLFLFYKLNTLFTVILYISSTKQNIILWFWALFYGFLYPNKTRDPWSVGHHEQETQIRSTADEKTVKNRKKVQPTFGRKKILYLNKKRQKKRGCILYEILDFLSEKKWRTKLLIFSCCFLSAVVHTPCSVRTRVCIKWELLRRRVFCEDPSTVILWPRKLLKMFWITWQKWTSSSVSSIFFNNFQICSYFGVDSTTLNNLW